MPLYVTLNLGFSIYSKMFNSHVVPIIDYSAGVWGYLKSVEGETIQNRATRVLLGVHKKLQFWQLKGIWVGTELKLDTISQI